MDRRGARAVPRDGHPDRDAGHGEHPGDGSRDGGAPAASLPAGGPGGVEDGVRVGAGGLLLAQRRAQLLFGRAHRGTSVPAVVAVSGLAVSGLEVATRSRASAREVVLLTVPSGRPSSAAACCSERSQ